MVEKKSFDDIKKNVVDGHKIILKSTPEMVNNYIYKLVEKRVPISGIVLDSEYDYCYGISLIKTEEIDEYSVVLEDYEVDIENSEDYKIKENNKNHKINLPLLLNVMDCRFRNKNIVILCYKELLDFFTNLVNSLNLENTSIVLLDDGFDCLYELCYQNFDDMIVAIGCFENEKIIADQLNTMGMKETENIVYISNSFGGHFTDKYKGFDWLLGNTYYGDNDYPGYSIYKSFDFFDGADNADDVKTILVLGNSATDPLFYRQKSWTECLVEKYKLDGKKVVIFNGAITDYNSGNELIKFVRDGLCLKPDIVISYSGFIDFRNYNLDYPYVNLNLMRTTKTWEENCHKKVIYGVKDDRTAYTRWLENEKSIYSICKEYGIKFYAVLQPWVGSNFTGNSEQLKKWYYQYWNIVFPEFTDLLKNANDFWVNIRIDRNDWLIDFTSIFDGVKQDAVFYDSIHVNEVGNKIVADSFKCLLKDVI